MKSINKTGSLLVEALLAVVILSVCLTVIIQSLTTSLRATIYSEDYSKMIVLLENKLVDLIAKEGIADGYSEEGSFDDEGRYRFSVETTDTALDQLKDPLNQVEVKAIWGEGSKTKNISVVIYLAKEKEDE